MAAKDSRPSVGHRDFVGGLWGELGDLQFRFMIEHGLRPHHVLLDIGCGSLRGGVRFIPYLDRGHYLGIDTERTLVDLGIENELGRTLYEVKRPEFVVSQNFEFSRFSRRPHFALAHAVFIHLTDDLLEFCFANLRRTCDAGTKFYATYFEGRRPIKTMLRDHPHVIFTRTREQMMQLGKASGWSSRYVGDWRHPRGQVMVEYLASD